MRSRPRSVFASTPLILLLGSLPLAGWAQGDKEPKKPADPADKQTAAPKPGRDRWPVKTASDPDAAEIDPTPVKVTVEDLLGMYRPASLPLDGSNPDFQNRRARPVETTVWAVEADIVDCRLMPDGDYRVTIRGVSGKTMVLEMPKPEPEFVSPDSKFFEKIKSARQQFDGKFKPTRETQPTVGHAVITGIGFFGRAYARKGTPPPKVTGNLIQLHPVLNIDWLAKPTAAFTRPKPPRKPAPTKPKRKPAP